MKWAGIASDLTSQGVRDVGIVYGMCHLSISETSRKNMTWQERQDKTRDAWKFVMYRENKTEQPRESVFSAK